MVWLIWEDVTYPLRRVIGLGGDLQLLQLTVEVYGGIGRDQRLPFTFVDYLPWSTEHIPTHSDSGWNITSEVIGHFAWRIPLLLPDTSQLHVQVRALTPMLQWWTCWWTTNSMAISWIWARIRGICQRFNYHSKVWSGHTKRDDVEWPFKRMLDQKCMASQEFQIRVLGNSMFGWSLP